MPDISYRIAFRHRDGSIPEEQWFGDTHTAWEAFRLFAEPDSSEIYCRVELNEINHREHRDTLLAALEFPFR